MEGDVYHAHPTATNFKIPLRHLTSPAPLRSMFFLLPSLVHKAWIYWFRPSFLDLPSLFSNSCLFILQNNSTSAITQTYLPNHQNATILEPTNQQDAVSLESNWGNIFYNKSMPHPLLQMTYLYIESYVSSQKNYLTIELIIVSPHISYIYLNVFVCMCICIYQSI